MIIQITKNPDNDSNAIEFHEGGVVQSVGLPCDQEMSAREFAFILKAIADAAISFEASSRDIQDKIEAIGAPNE